jgi:hypothetical protein
MDDRALVGAMLECYRNAHAKVMGAPSMHFARGDVSRSKHYPALVRAARALLEHEVPPESWAEWRMQYMKAKRQEAPLLRVCNTTTIERQHGYYRRSFDGGGVTYLFERIHYEQLFRTQEAGMYRANGCRVVDHVRWPPWYGELRRVEIDDGMLDPIEGWPMPVKKVITYVR